MLKKLEKKLIKEIGKLNPILIEEGFPSRIHKPIHYFFNLEEDETFSIAYIKTIWGYRWEIFSSKKECVIGQFLKIEELGGVIKNYLKGDQNAKNN